VPPLKTRERFAPGGAVLSAPVGRPRRALGGMNGARIGSVLWTASGRRAGNFCGEDGAEAARLPAASHSRRQRVASPLGVSAGQGG
jgi:hypothetical protein